MSADSTHIEAGKPAARNGKARLTSLDSMDKRTSVYRETAQLISALQADAGGLEAISTAKLQLIESAGLATAMRRNLGARWLAGEEVDIAAFCTVSNSERRLYETVGLNRVPRDVTSLGQLLSEDLHRG